MQSGGDTGTWISPLVRKHLGMASPWLGNHRFLGVQSGEGFLQVPRGFQAVGMMFWKQEPGSRWAAEAMLQLFGQSGVVGGLRCLQGQKWGVQCCNIFL